MMDDKAPFYEIKNIEKEFTLPHGQILRVLDPINFSLYPGEIVAIIGPSGCGKSTLLRILAGLEPASGGEILAQGKKQQGLMPEMSMVFQSFALYPWMTVKENISIALKALHCSSAHIERETTEAIALIGLTGFEDSYPREISGGMKQRVGLARALVRNPTFLFMDEPFSAVDAFTAESLRAELLTIWEQKKRNLRSILLVSHDIKEVVYMADKIIIMKANPGRITAILDNKVSKPRDYKSEAFLDLVDQLHRSYAEENPAAIFSPELQEAIGPLLMVSVDEILGCLKHLQNLGGTENIYKMGADSKEPFTKVVTILQAAELLNFVLSHHRMVTLTEEGKAFLLQNNATRRLLWKKQLLTIPLFVEVQKRLFESREQSLTREELVLFLATVLPHQDGNTQCKILLKWSHYGNLFSYRNGMIRNVLT